MYLRIWAVFKYLILSPLAIALYCEWFVYEIQPVFWEDFKCSGDDKSCTKVLFVADPQIQGDLAVPPPLNYVFNWDSDRFLRSTFSVVQKSFKPDVIVFLGDLMDEGSISTLAQFHSYVKRLLYIFDVDIPVVQVWLPGDNDIGGENEPVRRDKLAEFERVFQQPQIITYRNISFYKVNAITHNIPEVTQDLDDTNYKIVVSHYPIVSKSIYGRQPLVIFYPHLVRVVDYELPSHCHWRPVVGIGPCWVNAAIRPNIYFCAHNHESKYVKQGKDFLTNNQMYSLLYGSPVLNVAADDNWLYEIYVPTCSYRMGTSKIGYGAAIFENRNLRYTVLWSPQRFPQLATYLFIGVIIAAYVVSTCTRRVLSRSRRAGKWDRWGWDHTVPLLHRI